MTAGKRSARRARRLGGRRGRIVAGAALALLALPVLAAPSQGGTTLDVSVTGTGGGRSDTPGRACADGGDGASWHYDYRGDVPDGTLNARPAELRVHLDLHSDLVRFPHADPDALGDAAPPPEAGPAAFLAGTESRATFADDRGTLQVALTSGDCDAPTLDFDGHTAQGSGTWTVRRGTGGYEGASGNGDFGVTADVDPGAANDLTLDLAGDLDVRRPSLQAEVVTTFWGGLGADYLTRRPSVVYRIVNAGPGFAYGAELVETASPTDGAEALGPHQQALGDLAPGDEAFATVRYQLGLLEPCDLVVLGCEFDTEVTVTLPDVLDDVVEDTATVPARAPDTPPPL